MGALLDEDGVWSFSYDENWLAFPGAFPLSPSFPLRAERVIDGSSSRPVQWFFDNLLPEEAMRTAIAREAHIDENDSWGLLAYFGRESAGALTLLGEDEKEATGGRRPLGFEELERRIQAMPQHALTATAPKRMSAAGAQQKLLLVLDGTCPNYVLSEPVGNEPSMHLLKPDMRFTGYPHSAINEFFCMQLAEAMGLDVPPTHFLRVPSACYVIDRFDRDTSSQPASRRHTLDAMQLLGLDRTFKYREANVDSLHRCLRLVGTTAATRLALFKWSVFNVLIGNADAHLKNLSFFSTPRGYQLAPFYDLVSTVVYNTPTYQDSGERWPDCQLTMAIGRAKTFNDITRDHVLTFAERLDLRRRGAERELDSFLDGIETRIQKVRHLVNEIARPNAGEIRLLQSIVVMPLNEMRRKLSGAAL